MIRVVLTVILAFLVGCTGTGVKNASQIASTLEAIGGTGQVYVLRSKGWVASGALMMITLNGIKQGEIGVGETLILEAKTGSNSLTADIEGWQGIGLDPVTVQFDNDGDANSFFVLSLEQGLWTSKLKLIETTESGWKQEAQ